MRITGIWTRIEGRKDICLQIASRRAEACRYGDVTAKASMKAGVKSAM